MITVVTGFTANFQKYGQRFVESFYEFWPEDINLILYVEDPLPIKRGTIRYLDDIPGYRDFMERNNEQEKRGRLVKKSWKPKEQANGYSFRFDSLKFALQGFIPYDAAKCLDGHLIWMDADVVTYRPVTHNYLDKILKGHVTYLGRRGTHSEIGFVGYKLPEALPTLKQFHDYYDRDDVFQLKEWHSAYVFDQSIKDTNPHKVNLTPNGSGHVWFQSPLSLCFDHQKGKRKEDGGSKEVYKWADKLMVEFGDYLC